MNKLILKKGFLPMLKYHNDMNLIAFKDFSQRELNIFFSFYIFLFFLFLLDGSLS